MQSSSGLLHRLLARGKFRHVQVLLKLAELGSVQRTAQAIGLTQSSVTQTLAYLEQLLETRLFERHARGVRPSAACRDLLPVARQMLLGLHETAEVVVTRQERGRGVVRLAASVGAMHGLLIDSLPRFARAWPTIEVHLAEAEGDDQLLAIARGEVDLVACRRPAVVPEGWSFLPLLEDHLAVIASVDHALARRRGLRWADLVEQTWLLAPSGSAARETFDARTEHFDKPLRAHTVVTRSTTMLWWLLRDKTMLAFLPLNVARPLLGARALCELAVRPASPIEPLGLLRPLAPGSEAAERLAAFLQADVRTSPRRQQRR